MSLVHAAQHNPATHVLIIGVGRYPHLIDGSGTLLAAHQGLGQLSSPTVSARAIADWFCRNFHNRRRPLGSVRLLLSEETSVPFVHPKTGTAHSIDTATIDNIEAEVVAWKTSGDAHPESVMIFYFCGHGLADGQMLALLAEDFGRKPHNPLDGAMDFTKNRRGMSSCAAKRQLYLVDACRTNASMTRYSKDYVGRVFIQPDSLGAGTARPTLYSTLAGAAAHGRKDKPSHFAEALLEGLRGAGGDNTQGSWRVQTSSLHRAIEGHLRRKVRAGVASTQMPIAEDLVTFDIHDLEKAPAVPVIISCDPDAALASASLRCSSNGKIVKERAIPAPNQWEVELDTGSYDFEATFAKRDFKDATRQGELVFPPELNLALEVTP